MIGCSLKFSKKGSGLEKASRKELTREMKNRAKEVGGVTWCRGMDLQIPVGVSVDVGICGQSRASPLPVSP